MKCKLCGAFPLDAEGEQRQAAYDAETARADRAGAEIIELGKDKQTLMTGMSVLKERAEKAEAACVELLELAKWCANADGHTWAVQVKAKGEAILAQPHPGQRYLDLEEHLDHTETDRDGLEGLLQQISDAMGCKQYRYTAATKRVLDLAKLVEGCESCKRKWDELRTPKAD